MAATHTCCWSCSFNMAISSRWRRSCSRSCAVSGSRRSLLSVNTINTYIHTSWLIKQCMIRINNIPSVYLMAGTGTDAVTAAALQTARSELGTFRSLLAALSWTIAEEQRCPSAARKKTYMYHLLAYRLLRSWRKPVQYHVAQLGSTLLSSRLSASR